MSFGEYVTLDNRRLDSAPWSRRSRLQKALQNLEHQLRPGFPLNIWMMIGPLDDDGRKKLATLIERTRQWYQRRQEWELAQPLAEEVDGIIQ